MAAAMALAACSGGEDGDPSGVAAAPSAAAGVGDAAAVTTDGPCPANLVIQTDWFAEMEHGGLYQLIGDAGRADKERFTYSGPLQARYRGPHGVQTVEIRSGGAAIDGTVAAAMAADDRIYLGFINTDDIIALAAEGQAYTSVMATLDINPQMLMWNPVRYSILDFKDLARTRAKVLYFAGATYIDYLLAQGYLTEDQLDAGYDGSPARWLESDGDVIQQGFASNEVFTYTEALPEWRRPVDFFLIHWLGYETYPETLAMATDRVAAESDCLELLVPVLQQAWVDFFLAPGEVSTTVVRTLDTFDTFFRVTPELNERAVEIFKQYGIGSNGPDPTLGNFDTARVERMIGIVNDLRADRGDKVAAGLTAADIMTNEFVDDSIGLPEGWAETAGEPSG
jgi:hypothetical protein